MKRCGGAFARILLLLTLVPSPLSANTGVPLIAYVIGEPVMWAALVAVVAVEAWYAKRIIGVSAARAAAISSAANGASALVGFPFAAALIASPRAHEAAFGAAVLLLPAFFVSVYVERFTARLFVGREQRDAVRRWSWRANLTSYEGLIAFLILVSLAGRIR